MSKLPERLQLALKYKKATQSDLAAVLGCDKSTVSNYIKGKFEPKYSAIEQMAGYLDVNEAWLLGYGEVMNRDMDFDNFVIKVHELDLTTKDLEKGYKYLKGLKK